MDFYDSRADSRNYSSSVAISSRDGADELAQQGFSAAGAQDASSGKPGSKRGAKDRAHCEEAAPKEP